MRILQVCVRLFLALLLALAPVKALAGSMTLLGAGKVGTTGQPMVTPLFVDTNVNGPSNSATNYIGFTGGSFSATQVLREATFAGNGAVGNLRVNFPTALAGGTTYDICLVKNGSATCTALTCQITSASTGCNDTTHTVAVSAGDFLAWKIVPTGTPNAQTTIQVAATFTSTANGESFLSSPYLAAASASATNYTILGSSSTWEATEANQSGIIPAAGVIDQLYVSTAGTAPGAAKSIAVTIIKNGAPTSLTCTLTGTGSGSGVTFCTDTNTGHAFSVAAGDLVSIQTVPTGTPSVGNMSFSVRFVPTTPGEAIYMNVAQALSTSSARYLAAAGRTNSATENNALNVVPVALTWKKLYAAEDVAPGGAANRAIINRTGTGSGQSNGTMTCTITSAITSCSDLVNSYSASAGDFINYLETPTSTPAAVVYFKNSSVMTVP